VFRTAVGASGAIYGIIVAFVFMFPNAELALMFIPVPIKVNILVPGIVLVDFIFRFLENLFLRYGIAHFAHVGGALFDHYVVLENQFNTIVELEFNFNK
jgi:membrane associated rhomboid family serine protease